MILPVIRQKIMDKIVFTIREQSKANNEFGACDIFRTETVYADGRVHGRVHGTFDGRSYDERYARQSKGALNLTTVREGRLAAGWSVSP